MKNLSFQFPDGARILHNTSLTIRKGDKIALTGKSGSGKTTVMLLLLQFLKSDSGKILLMKLKFNKRIQPYGEDFRLCPSKPLYPGWYYCRKYCILVFRQKKIDYKKIQQLIQTLDLRNG